MKCDVELPRFSLKIRLLHRERHTTGPTLIRLQYGLVRLHMTKHFSNPGVCSTALKAPWHLNVRQNPDLLMPSFAVAESLHIAGQAFLREGHG